MNKILLLFVVLISANLLSAATYYVDNIKGNDANNGTRTSPFATIQRGIKALQRSDKLEIIANSGKPYTRPYPGVKGNSYNINIGGTAECPLVINGNGAIISGLSKVPYERWERISERIYALPFWPMSNMYKRYKKWDYWNPILNIWFVNGKEAHNSLSRQEMEKTENSFWWSRADRKVYFHLPTGHSIKNVEVQLPANSGFYAEKDYCIIKDLTVIYSWNDGFDTGGKSINVVFKRCYAINNCGQGFSCHGKSIALYVDCVAVRCGSSGSCNAHNSQASYVRCVLIDNVFETGAYNYESASSRFYDSIIIMNKPFEQIWALNQSSFYFFNSAIISSNPLLPLIKIGNGMITLKRSTLIGGKSLVWLGQKSLATINMEECLVGNMKDYVFTLIPNVFKLKHNAYFKSPGIVFNKHLYRKKDFKSYLKKTKNDEKSFWLDRIEYHPDTQIPLEIRPNKSTRIGAWLPKSVINTFKKFRKVKISPTGISF